MTAPTPPARCSNASWAQSLLLPHTHTHQRPFFTFIHTHSSILEHWALLVTSITFQETTQRLKLMFVFAFNLIHYKKYFILHPSLLCFWVLPTPRHDLTFPLALCRHPYATSISTCITWLTAQTAKTNVSEMNRMNSYSKLLFNHNLF